MKNFAKYHCAIQLLITCVQNNSGSQLGLPMTKVDGGCLRGTAEGLTAL